MANNDEFKGKDELDFLKNHFSLIHVGEPPKETNPYTNKSHHSRSKDDKQGK